jgi:hypothetical protein
MKTLLISLALFTGQMNTLQDRPVIHLRPHNSSVEDGFGGMLLELINGPATVFLPAVPPKLDSQGNPWSVDVKNLGPRVVTIIGKSQFSEPVNPGQTLHIHSNGAIYSLTH